MRTKNLYMAVAVLAIPFVSCSKKQVSTIPAESGEPEVELVEMTFDSEKEDIDATKLVIGGLTTADAHVYWNAGDAISVFDGVGNQKFTRIETEISRAATFSGSAAAGKSAYYSLSPYYADASMKSAGVISCRIPTQQTANIAYAGGDVSMDATALLAIAKSSEAPAGQVLKFQNLYSLIVFEVGSDYAGKKITSVTVEGNNLENIAGDFNVTVKDDALEYADGDDPASWVTLKPNGGNGTFAAGKYAIAVRPCVLENGYRIIVRMEGTKKSSIVAKTAGKELVRNSGLNTGAAAVSAAMAATDNFNYYAIHTKDELDEWNKDGINWASTDKVYLGADIDYDKKTFWRGANDVGTYVFSGTFDGRNHRIYNIVFKGQHTRAGFVHACTGVIKNVCFGSKNYDFNSNTGTKDGYSNILMDGANGKNTWYYAGLIPYLGAGTAAESKGTISGVANFCDVSISIGLTGAENETQNYFRAGGIAGTVKAHTSILNCNNFGSVTLTVDDGRYITGSENNVELGGITSRFDGTGSRLEGCCNYGTVTNNCKGLRHMGGIIGANTQQNSTFSDNRNYGIVQNKASIESDASGNFLCIGGVAGYISSSAVTNCINEQSSRIINEADHGIYVHVGGIVGDARGYDRIEGCSNAGTILNTGSVGDDDTIALGGICGRAYATSDTWSESSPKIIKCETTSTSEVKNTGLATDNAGMLVGGIVGWVDQANTIGGSSSNKCINRGSVTESSASPRPGVGGVIAYANKAGNDLSYCENYGTITFSGARDNSVAGVYPAIGGVTGWISEACTVDFQRNYGNVILKDFASKAFSVGGVLGTYNNTTTQTFNSLYNEGDITATEVSAENSICSSVGGICSGTYQGADKAGKTYKNCTNKGNINMGICRSGYTTVDNSIQKLRIGGIAGYANKNASGSLVSECNISFYNSSSSQTRATIGGIFGYCNLSSYSNCTYSGTIWTQSTKMAAYAGGIIGCVRHASPTLTNCNVSGRVTGSGSGDYMAGLFVSNDTKTYTVTFSNCKIKKGTIATSTTINSLSNITVALLTGASHSTGDASGVTVVDSF